MTTWSIPGLIDAHVHLTMDFGARTGLDRGSDALVRANGEAQLASGVVAVRDAGRIPPEARLDAAPEALQVVSCGAVLAPPGRFFPGRLHVEAPPADLVRIALSQLASAHERAAALVSGYQVGFLAGAGLLLTGVMLMPALVRAADVRAVGGLTAVPEPGLDGDVG